MNKDMKQEYIEKILHGEPVCPFCGCNGSVNGEDMYYGNTYYEQRLTCESCSEQWWEKYELKKVSKEPTLD